VIQIRDRKTDELLGDISRDELKALRRLLKRDNPRQRDRYIDADTIEYLEQEGAPASLVEFLRKCLGDREGIEIIWLRDGEQRRRRVSYDPVAARKGIVISVVAGITVTSAVYAGDSFLGIDRDVSWGIATGLLIAVVSIVQPEWFWTRAMSTKLRVLSTIVLLVCAGFFLWAGGARAVGIYKARTECLKLLANADYLHRSEMLKREPVPDLPRTFSNGRARRYTCADFAPSDQQSQPRK
jgi:hypothetical protein